jgi:hypothetical protein
MFLTYLGIIMLNALIIKPLLLLELTLIYKLQAPEKTARSIKLGSFRGTTKKTRKRNRDSLPFERPYSG